MIFKQRKDHSESKHILPAAQYNGFHPDVHFFQIHGKNFETGKTLYGSPVPTPLFLKTENRLPTARRPPATLSSSGLLVGTAGTATGSRCSGEPLPPGTGPLPSAHRAVSRLPYRHPRLRAATGLSRPPSGFAPSLPPRWCRPLTATVAHCKRRNLVPDISCHRLKGLHGP